MASLPPRSQRLLRQMLDEMVRVLWGFPGIVNSLEVLPRDGDHSAGATRRRVRLLRAVVERAERGLDELEART